MTNNKINPAPINGNDQELITTNLTTQSDDHYTEIVKTVYYQKQRFDDDNTLIGFLLNIPQYTKVKIETLLNDESSSFLNRSEYKNVSVEYN